MQRRPGRPAEFNKRVTVSVFLEAAERRALYAAARAANMSASRLARQFLVAGLTRHRARRRRRDR
jgi:AraC-like DNA-binding protein